MKNVGVYIGSFNPIHIGHVMISNYVIENTDIDKLIIVPSYHSFGKPELIDFNYRVEMIAKSIQGKDNILISTIESETSGYTYETLGRLKLGGYYKDISLVIGADNFIKLHTFKSIEWILKNCNIIVLCRDNCDITSGYDNLRKIPGYQKEKIKILYNFPEINMSSSYIRKEIKEGRDIFGYVMPEVRKYIQEHKLYKE